MFKFKGSAIKNKNFTYKLILLVLALFTTFLVFLLLFIRPYVEEKIISLEEKNAKESLDKITNYVTTFNNAINQYKSDMIKQKKLELKNIVNTAYSFIYNDNTTLSKKELKDYFKKSLQNYSHGDHEYFFISDYNQTLIMHGIDEQLVGKTFKEVLGFENSRSVDKAIKQAILKADSFAEYKYLKPNGDEFLSKISYFKKVDKFRWLISAGVYTEDINIEINKRFELLKKQLSDLIKSTKVGDSGYTFIIDGTGKAIIHPNPKVEGMDIKTIKELDSERNFFQGLVESYKNNEPYRYKWYKIEDNEKIRKDKIVWTNYNKDLDWYINSSLYTDDLSSTSKVISKYIYIASFISFVILAIISYLVLNRLNSAYRKNFETMELLDKFFNAIPLNIYAVDSHGIVTFTNRTFNEYFPDKNLHGAYIYDLLWANDKLDSIKNDKNVLHTKLLYDEIEEHLCHKTNENKYYRVIKFPILENHDKAIGVQSIFWDITKEYLHEQMLEHSAKHDYLTDLPNRMLFNELLQSALYRCERHNIKLALLYIDLDGFKEINDKHGHEVGDAVLLEVTKRIKSIVRQEDIVSRIGGDEFAVAITELNSERSLLLILDRLSSSLSNVITRKNGTLHELSLSASIGVSIYTNEIPTGPDSLLRQADQAMYDAKTKGKNQYQFYSHDKAKQLVEEYELIESTVEAIENEQLVLHYQPKVNMSNGNVYGVEALVRWNHPQKGLLYPDSFLPFINNDEKVMLKLFYWVINTAFEQLSSWNQSGLELIMSINVSSHEFEDNKFIDKIVSTLNKFDTVKPEQIEFEVLESNALNDMYYSRLMIKKCQKLGFKVSLDDFGTGYSTLSYLKELPVDTLKIDKSFTMEMLFENASFSIIEAAMGLAEAFRCDVIAEGVESIEHGQVLLQLGCKYGQGYAISKPLEASVFDDWIKDYKHPQEWRNINTLNFTSKKLLYAIIEHKNWIYILKNHLKDKDNNIPELNPKLCRFGEWLQNEAKTILNVQDYKKVDTLHKSLHEIVNTILSDTSNIDDSNLEVFDKKHIELVDTLKEIINSIFEHKT